MRQLKISGIILLNLLAYSVRAQEPSILKDVPTKFGMSMEEVFDSVRLNFLCHDADSEGVLHPRLKRIRIGNIQAYGARWNCALSGQGGSLEGVTLSTISAENLGCAENPHDGEFTVSDWMDVCNKLDAELKKPGKPTPGMDLVWKIGKHKFTSWFSKGNLWMTLK